MTDQLLRLACCVPWSRALARYAYGLGMQGRSQQSGETRLGWIRGNVEERRRAEAAGGSPDDKKYAVVISPEVVGVLTFFFSPIPGFVLLAINQGRMHQDDR